MTFLKRWTRVLLTTLCLLLPGVGPAATLSVSCGAVGRELTLCRAAAERWARQTGNEVRVVSTPSSTNERLALYQQLLAAGSPDIDLFQIDVIWPGILAAHLVDLRPYIRGAEGTHFPALVANNTVGGRLVAIPWFTSAGLLYYRSDLLERYAAPVPETWAELEATAGRIQAGERERGDGRMWGYVWQGRAYEGLTCNALEWIASHGGGRLVDDEGRVTIDNPRAARALDQAAAWVGEITPPGVLNYAEEEARGVFQTGHAVFMRNWPYAWALAQAEDSPVRGRVGVAPLPKGARDGVHASTFGGWQLAVSRYSRHPALAAALALYLSAPAEQRRRAIAAAYAPSLPALYDDPEVLAANPFFGALRETLLQAVPRPSAVTGVAYNRVSTRFWNAVHGVLAGRRSGTEAVHRLGGALDRLRRRGRW